MKITVAINEEMFNGAAIGAGVVDPSMLPRVFAIVQGLEKCLSASQRMLACERRSLAPRYAAPLLEQANTLLKMRRAANHLQLEFANQSWAQVVRTLQIFDGLHQIARPEIMNTYSTLANGIQTHCIDDAKAPRH